MKQDMSWHETCTCKCRLDENVCNDKQHWNTDKCRSECKELINKGRCDKGFIWNPSIRECTKSCDVGEYLDYANCKCRKRLIDKLVEECSENIDGNYMVYNYEKVCNSCTIYICITSAFIYF